MNTRSAISVVLTALILGVIAASPSPAQTPIDEIMKAIQKKAKTPVPIPTPTAPTSAAAPVSATAPAGQTLNARLAETLMGPMLTGPGVSPRIFMSEDGERLAIVTPKGSRQVVLLDGVEGPVFDEIPSIFLGMVQVAVQFSPTGGHSAYLGRRGGDLIAVVDGKEAATVANSQTNSVSGSMGWSFWFNRDGSHIAYAGRNGPAWVMLADGVKSTEYREIDLSQTLLNGKRLAYVAQTADQQWHAVVDGKPGPGYVSISSLKLTPDGAHYAYVAQPAGSPNPLAVVDGVVQGPMFPGVPDLEQAPDGRVAYVAATKAVPGGAGGVALLMVGGVAVPGSCGTGRLPMCLTFGNRVGAAGSTPERHVAWSPDGKGFAYIQSNDPNPGVTVMANGKAMGPTYTSASQLLWSPDGRRFAYLGTAPTGRFPVVDGEELAAVGDLKEIQFSPDGKRYGFIGYGANGFSVVVDGKNQPTGQGYNGESFRWSPDGKHFAYGVQSSINSFGPVVDGEVKPMMLGSFAPMNYGQQITFPPLLFSPDSRRLAYVGRKSDATGKVLGKLAVVVDGVSYEGPSQSYMFPSFSPDSSHFASVLTTGQGWTVMIDGKVSPYYEDVLKAPVAACRFVDGHTFRFYGIKAGQIYRVTLDVGA